MRRDIHPGKTEKFVFDLAPPEKAKSENARLRIHTEKPFGDAELTVKMNGAALEPSDDLSAYYNNPYDGMISDPPRRRAWNCPVGILKNGLNDLQVVLTSGDMIRTTFIDLAVS